MSRDERDLIEFRRNEAYVLKLCPDCAMVFFIPYALAALWSRGLKPCYCPNGHVIQLRKQDEPAAVGQDVSMFIGDYLAPPPPAKADDGEQGWPLSFAGDDVVAVIDGATYECRLCGKRYKKTHWLRQHLEREHGHV